MKLFLIFLFSLFLFAKDGVQTYREVKDDQLYVYITNNNLFDITYKYYATYDELLPIDQLPITKSLEANTTEPLAKFMLMGKKYKLTNSYSWTVGNKYSTHNKNYFYRLPYALGETHQVTQSFHGSFSHSGDSEFAVDFGIDRY